MPTCYRLLCSTVSRTFYQHLCFMGKSTY
ncbi:TPA: hypothetical protein ACHW0W_001711 [Streptococcus equi subsp. zooepidemicus]